MLDEFLWKEFSWGVSPNGYFWLPPERYEWAEDLNKSQGNRRPQAFGKEPILVENAKPRTEDDKGSISYEAHQPFIDHPNLFREFANLDHSPDGIQAFANKYGDLTSYPFQSRCIVHVLDPSPAERGLRIGYHALGHEPEVFIGGTLQSTWIYESCMLRELLEIFDCVRDPSKHEELKRWVKWGESDTQGVYFHVSMTNPMFNGLGDASTYFPIKIENHFQHMQSYPFDQANKGLLCEPGDFVYPAMQHIARVTNRRITEHTQLSLVPSPIPLSVEHEQPYTRLRLAPDSLLAALWLQFAGVFSAAVKSKRCGFCGEPFLIDRLAKQRSSRKYCSNSCQQKAKRARAKRLP